MNRFSVAPERVLSAWLSLLLLVAIVVPTADAAYTPESPKVRDLATKAVQYLEGLEHPHSQLGGVCLRGLACYKYYHRYNQEEKAHSHKHVKAGIDAIRAALKKGIGNEESINYSLGIAIIFLCEIDGNQKQYRAETEALLAAMYKNQRPDGAWSYHDYPTGDTSQTQYGVLGSWYAMKKGYQIPADRLERAVDWLIRTQDPSGAVPYQGKDPGSYNRIKQGELRLSMSPAALGCLYIAEDLAGLAGTSAAAKQKQGPFRSATASKRTAVSKININKGMLQRAIDDGNRYYAANYRLDIGKNFHYYLYSLERYQAMKAFSEAKRDGPAPWYDAGIDFLGKSQRKDGSWDGTRGPDISTSFALLFIVRSMEIAIEETAGGQSRGGYGLPDDLTKLTADSIQDGQVVAPPKFNSINKVLEDIANADLEELRIMAPNLDNVTLDPDRGKRQEQVDQLRQLLSKGSFQQRYAAAKMLAANADIDSVPHLIYALTDGDHRVVKTARDGLRKISRKFDGFGLGDTPTKEEKEAAADDWRRWYRSVRPTIETADNTSEE